MKIKTIMNAMKGLLITVLVLAIQWQAVQAQILSVKNYKLTVKGTSSLHDWESVVDRLEAKGSYTLANNTLSDIRNVVVRIPVKAIKNAKGKLMDNKTWEAFNYEKNPTITFTMTEKKIDAADNSLDATGTLTMAGVTKPVLLHLIYKCLPGGDLKITGAHTLRMSDFKMEPPTAIMGAVKVGDEVVVAFEMILNMNNSL